MSARAWRLGALGTAVLVAATAPHALAVTAYHPDRDAREFRASAGGWTGTTASSNPACSEGVTCPAVEEGWVASDGADGADDGFITVRVSTISSLLTTTVSSLQGPPFTYGGDAGAKPRDVRVTADARADDGQLLSALSRGDVAVFLDDLTSGESIPAIAGDHPDEANGWTALPAAKLDPRRLRFGHDYRLRIVNTLEFPFALVPAGSFDFDNVVVRAGGAGDGATARALRRGVRAARLSGNRLAVRLRCPAAAAAACRFALVARVGGPRSAAATKRTRATVAPGKTKRVRAKVKPRHVAKLARKRRVTLTGFVRSGAVKAAVSTRVVLRRR